MVTRPAYPDALVEARCWTPEVASHRRTQALETVEGVMLLDRLLKRRAEPVVEKRSSGSGYTAAIMAARESYISGRSGLGRADRHRAGLREPLGGRHGPRGRGGHRPARPPRHGAPGARAGVPRRGGVPHPRPAGAGERLGPVDPRTASRGPIVSASPRRAAGARRRCWRPRCCTSASRPTRWRPGPARRRCGGRRSRRSSCTRSRRRCSASSATRRSAAMIVPLDAGGGEALEEVRGSLRGRRGGALVVEYLSQAIAGGAPVPGRGPDHLTPPLREAAVVETLAAARDGDLPTPSACCRRCSTRPPRGRWCARRSGIWRAGRLQPIAALVAEEASREARRRGRDRRDAAAAGLRRRRPGAGAG